MTSHKLTILVLSFNGMAQNREVKLEISPKAPKDEPVKIEQINNQDILRISSQADTNRIPQTDDTRAKIKCLMQSSFGSGLSLKDNEGSGGKLVWHTKACSYESELRFRLI